MSNLAFLCFDHHDVYDSTSSQRKNYTIGEVKELRSELYTTIGTALVQDVHFGQITTPARDPYAGSYIRIDCGPDSAELRLTPLPDSYEGDVQYYVSGLALWGADRPRGPNLGTLEFIGVLRESREITHVRHSHSNERVITCLMFSGDGHMSVDEDNVIGEYGMNVSFSGTYRRA